MKGDRQQRGRWGETQLQRLIEMTGLDERLDFDTQIAVAGVRPDLILRLPHRSRLAIDAKVPMDDYLAAAEEPDAGRRETALKRHARKVRNHAGDLAKRAYPRKLADGPPFTVMFLPIESLLVEAIRHDDELLRFAADRNIVLATPHTLLGFLWSVAAMWKHDQGTRNAETMRQAALEPEDRMGIFLDRFAKVGRRLAKTVEEYDSAVGSWESRLRPQFRTLRRLGGQPEHGSGGRDVPERVESIPRRLDREDRTDPPAPAVGQASRP